MTTLSIILGALVSAFAFIAGLFYRFWRDTEKENSRLKNKIVFEDSEDLKEYITRYYLSAQTGYKGQHTQDGSEQMKSNQ